MKFDAAFNEIKIVILENNVLKVIYYLDGNEVASWKMDDALHHGGGRLTITGFDARFNLEVTPKPLPPAPTTEGNE